MTAPWTARLSSLEGLDDAAHALQTQGRAALRGLTGTARLLSGLVVAGARSPLLVLVPAEREVETATEDLRTLSEALGLAGEILPFPAPGPLPFRSLARHPEASLARAVALLGARNGQARAIVASPAGLLRGVLAPDHLENRTVVVRSGDERSPESLVELLEASGYIRNDPVSEPGEMARRGFILDVFPPDRDEPVRAEFLGDTIESLRGFDPRSQRSTGPAAELRIHPASDVLPTRALGEALRDRLLEALGPKDAATLVDRLGAGILPDDVGELLSLVDGALVAAWTWFEKGTLVVLEPELVLEEMNALFERCEDERTRSRSAIHRILDQALVSPEALASRLAGGSVLEVREVDPEGRGIALLSRPVRRYAGDVRALVSDLRPQSGLHVFLLGSPGRAERLCEVLREDGFSIGDEGPVVVGAGALHSGFELPEIGLSVFADGDVYPEEVRLHKRGRRAGIGAFLSDFRDLRPGDLVVHEDHGIGRFEGLQTLEVGGVRADFMVLGYLGGDRLKVPVEAFDRIQKYTAGEGVRPALDRLGSGKWESTKRRVKKAMRDMAEELLALYALRKARPGHAFTGESPWMREFEEGFEFEETEDQSQAIADVAKDMTAPVPMDRLVCGDVGYGKTEVAMRAAMRAVLDGKQVAVLAPTTVLAFQHWKTFRRRFAPFPVTIDMISRFRSPKEIKKALHEAREGRLDILIGTHRLLSKDVGFADLGLLVIDEEQRFGVAAKERLKQLQKTVDCLTLSATPIPRTLQMALSGLRDMSVIETPPKDRLAIHTEVLKHSDEALAAAVRQELSRDGQVFVVHDRVEGIDSLAHRLSQLVPEATVTVAHGQMPEAALERRMLAFVEGRCDVLVATTIVENGLDIPRANTILINRADRFGLAQLYQLRGRVGRSDRRAYAYLLVAETGGLSEIARKRLAAIQEFSDLGAGFRVAALDLELRGAGNLLGGEQSGQIEAVGLDLYSRLLEQQVLELQGNAKAARPRANLNLRLDLGIPDDYVAEVQQRMSFYKRLAEARRPEEHQALAHEMVDRNGPMPQKVRDLFRCAALRLRAEELGVAQIERSGNILSWRFVEDAALAAENLVAVVSRTGGAALSPGGVLRVPMDGDPLATVEATLGALEQRTLAVAPAAS